MGEAAPGAGAPRRRSEGLEWLYGTQLFGVKFGLDGIRQLCRGMGVELERPGYRVIHVAGTNGKGSTCRFVESLCRGAGLRTGLFTDIPSGMR